MALYMDIFPVQVVDYQFLMNSYDLFRHIC